jgi:hypothetical protein
MKDKGMKNKQQMSKVHVQVIVLATLQMFNEGTICDAADITSVFKFSPHFVKQVVLSELTAALIYSASSRKVVAYEGTYKATLMYPQRINQGEYGWGMRWSSNRSSPANACPWELAI